MSYLFLELEQERADLLETFHGSFINDLPSRMSDQIYDFFYRNHVFRFSKWDEVARNRKFDLIVTTGVVL